MPILIITLSVLNFIGWIYEFRNESEEEKRKKVWLFESGLY